MAKARSARITAGALVWLAAAVAATVVGMTAVGAIGDDILGSAQAPISQAEVERRLAAVSTPTATPSATPTASATPPGNPTTPATTTPPADSRLTTTEAGSIISRCVPGGVEVISAVPAQGYQVETDDDEDEDHPSITFTAGETEVEVRLRCVNGTPEPEIRRDDD